MDGGLSPEHRGPVCAHAEPRARARLAGGIAAPLPPPARVALCLAWLVLLLAPRARAEQPLIAPSGLHGGRYVGLADPPAEGFRLSGSLGYAFTESVLHDDDRHQRLTGELYGAWLKWPALQIALGSELHYDGHQSASGPDSGVLIASRLTTRHALRVHPRLALAAQPSVFFPGASSAADGFRAASFELSGLGSYTLSPGASLGFSFGYRIDRTKYAIPEWRSLSPSDRLAASLSSHDAYLLGAIATFPLWSLRAAVELSWDVPATRALVDPIESPMRLRTALQKQVSTRFMPGVELGIDASARPAFEGLVRVEPRFWARVGVSVSLDPTPPPPSTAPPASATTATHQLVVAVVDARGWPLAGARVAIAEPPQAVSCDQFGRATLDLPPDGAELTVEAEGYQSARQQILPGAAGMHTVMLAASLPAGEIKGTVRDLAGEPLRARIEVLPLGLITFSGAQGQFWIEVPPGDYTLRISAEGHRTQDRQAQVELRGVTIVVVDLRETGR